MASSQKRSKVSDFGTKLGGDLVAIDRLQVAISSVGRVVLPTKLGSCSLVSLPRLHSRKDRRVCILTNAHVVSSKEAAKEAVIELEETDRDLRTSTTRLDLQPDDYFVTNRDLDFTIVAVNMGKVTKKVMEAVLDLHQTADVGVRDVVSIVQHPSGGHKQISSQCVLTSSDDMFECAADIQPGSSGSPVFSNWLLAGLTFAVRRDNGASCCTSMRAILKCIGAEVRPEGFLDQHRVLFRPVTAQWEWMTSPSRLHPIDVFLASTMGRESVLFVAVPKGTLHLRSSSNEEILPKLDDLWKEVSKSFVFTTSEAVVSISSSTFASSLFRVKVLTVSSMSIPESRAVRGTFEGSGPSTWFFIRSSKGKCVDLQLKCVEGEPLICFLTAHSKDDLIEKESEDMTSHQVILQQRLAGLRIFPRRDAFFVHVFWKSTKNVKFELTIRQTAETNPTIGCTETRCTICKKHEAKIANAPVSPSIFGPIYSMQVQRLIGSVFGTFSRSEITSRIQWGNLVTDHSNFTTRICNIVSADMCSHVLVKSLRRELVLQLNLENPGNLLHFYRCKVMMQNVASTIAQEFNHRLLHTNVPLERMHFGEIAVLWLPIRKEHGLVEQFVGGKYEKYTSPNGRDLQTAKECERAGAFSHFSFLARQRLIVCNICGIGSRFFNPIVHTNGDSDIEYLVNPQHGNSGIRDFLAAHVCNYICRALGLTR